MYEVCVRYVHRARVFGATTALEGYRCPPSQARRPGLRARTQSQACQASQDEPQLPAACPGAARRVWVTTAQRCCPLGSMLGGRSQKGPAGVALGQRRPATAPWGHQRPAQDFLAAPGKDPGTPRGGGRAATVLSGTFHPGTQHAQCPSQGLLSQDVRLRSAPSVSTTDPGTAATLSG